MGAAQAGPSALELVRRLWALYEARRWTEAQQLFRPEACCHWWATRERFVGAPAIVQVNVVYPEGWRIHLLEVNPLQDGRVHSLVRVDHGGSVFYANSFFTLQDGLIMQLDEYWADGAPPPDWRAAGASLPGQHMLPPDRRQGLSWQP